MLKKVLFWFIPCSFIRLGRTTRNNLHHIIAKVSRPVAISVILCIPTEFSNLTTQRVNNSICLILAEQGRVLKDLPRLQPINTSSLLLSITFEVIHQPCSEYRPKGFVFVLFTNSIFLTNIGNISLIYKYLNNNF